MKKLLISSLSVLCLLSISSAQNISVETTNGQVTEATVDGIPINNDQLAKNWLKNKNLLIDKEKRQKRIEELLSSNNSLARTNENVYVAPGLGLEKPSTRFVLMLSMESFERKMESFGESSPWDHQHSLWDHQCGCGGMKRRNSKT